MIDRVYSFKMYLKNSSGHDIEIFFYKDGNIASNKTIELKNSKQVETGHGTILLGSMKFESDSSSYDDSALVVFDKKYSKIHYGVIDSVNNSNNGAISSRNIFNLSNYKITEVDKINSDYIYTFTEQDYLDAQ